MEDTRNITLVLADDHGIVREGIAAKFREQPGVSIVGECSDGVSALETIIALRPDFAILDLQMPLMSGLEVIRNVREAGCETKLIGLSIVRDELTIHELFRSGADGYVLKDGPARHLFEAIRYISDGGRYLTPLLQFDPVEHSAPMKDPLSLLSKREFQVFSLLVDGKRPKDIAEALSISPKTVDTYRASIMRKLNLVGVAALVRFAMQRNMVTSALPC